MVKACIHFTCCHCGPTVLCLTAPMRGDYITCGSDHRYFVTMEERDKINLAFNAIIGTSIDVFVS